MLLFLVESLHISAHSFVDSLFEHFWPYTDFDLEGVSEDFVDSPVVDSVDTFVFDSVDNLVVYSVGGTNSISDIGPVADIEFLGVFADNPSPYDLCVRTRSRCPISYDTDLHRDPSHKSCTTCHFLPSVSLIGHDLPNDLSCFLMALIESLT